MLIDLAGLSANQAYFTLTQTVIPRPIAWVLTENKQQAERESTTEQFIASDYNLAPFSFFNAITGDPPIIMFAVGKKPNGDDKDTLVNIRRSQRFVVHIADFDALEELNQSAATLAYGESEVEQNELSLRPFESSALPRVAQAPIALNCELYRLDEIGHTPQQLVFGEVKSIWVDEQTVSHFSESPFRLSIDASKVDPLERLGGAEYARMGKVVKLPRPD